MPTQSENTRRIAKNTLMLYVRMLFSISMNFASETQDIEKWSGRVKCSFLNVFSW